MTTYTLAEIGKHAAQNDYWVIMGDNIYAFKDYTHSGGWDLHKPYAGGKGDMTKAFEDRHGSITNGA